MSTLTVKIELGGGLETLFSNKRSHSVSIPKRVPLDNTIIEVPLSETTTMDVDIPVPAARSRDPQTNMNGGGGEDGNEDSKKAADVAYLIQYMRKRLLSEREELFVEGDTVRPGILVLINDTDWELEGEDEYILQDGDEVVFISTLHGG